MQETRKGYKALFSQRESMFVAGNMASN